MAKRNREAALKRAREKARQDKREAKRERQENAKQGDEVSENPVDEQALMEEFARLSELHETNQISTDEYNEERHRIFVALDIEAGD